MSTVIGYLVGQIGEFSGLRVAIPEKGLVIGCEPTDEGLTLALTRHGKPVWCEADFHQPLYTLGCAGYGWLRPEDVRRELERMTAEWER
jgi:hypothetical protein